MGFFGGPPERPALDTGAARVTDLGILRQKLSDAIWETRLTEAREREAVVRRVIAAIELGNSSQPSCGSKKVQGHLAVR